MLAFMLVLTLTSMALAASAGCTAINGGFLNYTGKSQPLQTRTILLTNFYGGDRLTYTHTSNPGRAGTTLILSAGPLYLTQQTTTARTHTMTGTVGTLLDLELLNLAATAQSNDPDSGLILPGLFGTPTDIVVTVTCIPAPAPTTMTLSSTSPTVFGQAGSVSATVVSTSDGPATGNVVFTVDGVAQAPAALNGSGVASFSMAGLGAKNYTVSASYGGNSSYVASTATLAGGYTVAKANTATAVTSSSPSASFGSSVTFTATTTATAPGSGTPTGSVTFSVDGADTATVALNGSGVATWSSNALAVGTRTVAARYVTTTDYAASSGTLSGGQAITRAATTTAVTQSAASTTYGQSVTFTATVGSGVGTPTGSVIFSIDGAAQAPVTLNGAGVATLATSNLAVGSHTVSASYAGTASLAASSGSVPGGHQVNSIPTSTDLSGPGSVVFGNSATVTASVTSGNGVPTGSVTFTVDGTPRAPVALDAGSASVTLTGLAAGTHSVSASYAGSTIHGASSGALSGGQVVTRAATTTSISPVSAVSVGQSLSLTATVASAGGTPTGSVIFTIDGVAQDPVNLANGQAQMQAGGLAVGNHSITAAYSGADNFATSNSATATGTINKAASSLLVASAANPSVAGQGITLSATASSAAGTPAGAVIFTIDTTDQAPVTLSAGGVATLNLPNLPVGTHAVSATYQGDADRLASSASLPGGQTVARAATTLALSSDAPSPALGAAVTFSAAVSPVAPGAGLPAGNVIFSIDGVAQAPAALSGGTASITRSNLGVGSHTITALYVGDTNFTQSSGTLSGGQAVVAATTAASLTFSPVNPSYGGSATFTATVTASGGTPVGDVVFTVNGVDRAPVSLVNGSVDLVLTDLVVGSYTLGARFVATPNYLASTAVDKTMVVGAATTSTSVSASPATIRFGESTTLSATVSSASGMPAGSVEFYAEAILLGTATLSNGTASLATAALARGDRTITALYVGTANHLASIGALAGPLAVTTGATTLTVTAAPAPARFGQDVVLTATATAPAGTPAGDVIFSVAGVAQPASTLVNGVATLTISGLEPGIHTASVSYPGSPDHAAASASVSGGIVVTRADAVLTVGTSPAAPVFGDSITVTATLAAPASASTADIVFVIDGVARPPVTPAGGIASLPIAGLAAGSHSIEARFAGDSQFNPATATAPTVTIAPAGTSMVLGATPAAPTFGDSVTLTATLTSPAGMPSGVVVFVIDGTPQAPAALSAGGVATLTTAGLTVGPHAITASYAAQNSFDASTATLGGGVYVDVAATTTTVSGPATAITVGDTATFTATVTAAHGTPSGTVVFAVDGVNQAPVTLVGGSASIDRVLGAGAHSVTATYGGAANFAPSSDSLDTSLVVNKANSALVVSAPPTTEYGAALVATATATAVGGGGTPGGTVIFYVDSIQVGSGILSNGVATMTLSQQAVGSHTVTAAYAGDLNFAASVAVGAVTQVNPAATDTTITATPTTVVTGQPATVTITVHAQSDHAAATGSVTVTVGTTDYIVPLVNGVATLVLNGLAPGTYAISADYAGGTNFAPSDAALGTSLVVQSPPSDIGLTADLPRSVSGTAFAGSFTAWGGVPYTSPAAPYQYTVSAGALPPGLTLDADTGALTGTAGTAGTYNFTVTATGQAGAPGVLPAQLIILAPATITLPGSLANGTYGVDFAQSVAATGGTDPIAYAVTLGALPQGVSLDATTGALTGAPTQLGTANFIITATDANLFSGNQAYSVTIAAPTIAVSGSFPGGTVGASYGPVATSVSGGATPYSFSFDGNLPPGLSVNPSTGALSGMPSADASYSFGIIATDANGFSGRVDVTMAVIEAPVISLPATLAVPRQNRPYSQSLTASGGTPPYGYAVTSGALPDGLTLNTSTGRISGTPTGSGSSTFEISATDPTTLSGSRSYTLNVQAAAVLVVDANLDPIIVNQPYSDTITVTGGNAPYSFTLISGTLPTGIALDAATGLVSGTATTPGAYNLVLDIADFLGDTVTVGVNLQVLAPTIVVSATLDNHAFGTPATGSISASGGTAPYNYAATGLPAGVTISSSGVVSGTATVAGTFSAVVTATDSKTYTGSETVPVTITPPTLTLSVLPLDYMIGRAVDETITPGGGRGPYVLAQSGNLPDGLSFDTATGKLTGTPTATGQRSFTITATDQDSFTVSRTYAVETVTNIGTAVLPGSLPAVTAGVAYTGTLTATGGAAPLSYALTSGTLPAGLSMSATGVITGTTIATGNFPITLTVTGADGRINTASYTLVVNAPTLAAGGTLAGGVAGVAYSDTVPVSGGQAPYTVVLKTGALPLDLNLTSAGLISGTPTEAGSFPIVVTVTDDNLFAADIGFTLTIAAPTISLSAGVPAGRIGQAYTGAITVTGGVTPLGFAVTSGTLPAGLSLNSTSGAITGTPTVAGTSTVTITATDANSFTGARSYEFAIATNMGAATLGSLDTPLYKTPYSDSVAASGGTGPYGYAVTTGALPTGLGLDTATGAVTGSATVAGSFGFTITATDANGLINQQTYLLAIAPPVITVSASPPAGRVSVSYPPTTVTVSGGTTPYVFALENAPPGLVINAGTGVISGTPTTMGSYNFNVVVTDDAGFSKAQAFVMTVGAAPITLNLPASLPDGVTLTPYSVSLAPDNAIGAVSYSVTAGALPLGLSLNGSSGVISGTPLLGSYSFTIRAEDADGNIAIQPYGITVSLLPPLFVPTSIDLASAKTAVVTGETFTVTAEVKTAGGNANNGLITLRDDLSGATLGRASVTVTVLPPSGITSVPTGTMLLQVTGQPDRTLTLAGGAVTFTYPAGSFGGAATFNATYSGDARFTAATDGVSVLASAVMATQTVVTVSPGQVVLGNPVTATIAVNAAFAVDEGQVAVFLNGALVNTVPVIGGEASVSLTNLVLGSNSVTANYLGSPNYAASSGSGATVTVTAAPQGDLSVSLQADVEALFAVGQSIDLTAIIGANGAPASGIAVASALGFSCPQASLAAGQTIRCTATYRVTAADIARGRVDFSATVSATGMAPVVATLTLVSAIDEIAETFKTLSDNFVADRSRVIGNAIPLPNILQRRANVAGTRAGTVQASGDGMNQMLSFASSLQDWNNYAASQAADELALGMAAEPLPFNIWIDSQYSMHAVTGDDARWGSVGTVAMGADYLFGDYFMAGIMVQADFASETSGDGKVGGSGYLLGPYISIALGENLAFDATVLYGQSNNTVSSTVFGDYFSGDFDTTRLTAKAALTGFFEVDALTIRPNATFILSSESIGAYNVRNADGDAVAVPSGSQLHYQLTVGASFEYEILLDDGATLTPMLGFDVGISGNAANGADPNQTMIGRVSTGLEYETDAGLIIGLELSTEIDSGGFSSAEIRASIKGRF